MDNLKIYEMPNFEYSPQGFLELKNKLKEGRIVRNPFAKFYNQKVEITVLQDKELKVFPCKNK